ncbi:hypothetical protein RvY_01657 [Ramazzottius varieornatus]|uniref:ClpX-type ZB domain-containing protein n=1 Tax=Ramazzottius varieornatus TaxID=947166 RepID=A0A1D1UN38_RAMVA|nr:hypothetical protein RvY_01657 [Ramazzottius varieornatus]
MRGSSGGDSSRDEGSDVHSKGGNDASMSGMGSGEQRPSNHNGRSGSGSRGGGSKDTTWKCPRCGSNCTLIDTSVASPKFASCKTCHHLFLLLNKSEATGPSPFEASRPSRQHRKVPPPPKLIYEFLNKHVVGQNRAKKVLSVAVYNHYKRLSKSIPEKERSRQSRGFGGQFGGPPDSNGISLLGFPNAGHFGAMGPLGQQIDSSPHGHVGSSGGGRTYGSLQLEENEEEEDIRLEKSNILMLGPTGSGKTLLAQTIAKCLDVPIAICDCTTLTQAGYVGEDIESIIGKLLVNADGDVQHAEQGIVFLDEVDKISAAISNQQIRDVGGEGVQQGLLKLLEGTTVNVQYSSNGRKLPVPVDTTNILFIASGAFTGLDRIVAKRSTEKNLGFFSRTPGNFKGSERISLKQLAAPELSQTIPSVNFPSYHSKQAALAAAENKVKDNLVESVESADLVDFGMIPEFIGRLPIVVPFHNLSLDMLVQILTEPKNAVIPQYKKLFEMDKVELEFSQDAIVAVAEKALARRTGARGLRSILESVLLDAMFESPGSTIKKIQIDKDAILGHKPVQYIREKAKAQAGQSGSSDQGSSRNVSQSDDSS